MIQVEQLLKVFYNAVDIIPEGDDSVFLGSLFPTDAPAGVDAVMLHYTKYIDRLLDTLPLNAIQRLQLETSRAFTYEEYKRAFEVTIREKGFTDYPIYRVLLITSDKEKRLFTQSRKDTYEDYLKFLSFYTRTCNPFLHAFLYETHA